ncbi:hypothetical protein D9M71_723350 [compost metagenome]
MQRPLLDIAPVYPEVAAPPPLPADPNATLVEAVEAAAPPASRPRPIGLRLEQTLGTTATPARTVFGLRRQYGCFWITL